MKITDFRTLVFGTPWRNLSYLVLETDSNLTGIGEARVVCKTHTVLEYLRDVRRHIVGHDPFDVEDLYRRLTVLDFGKPGEVVMTGLALVEMACWDVIGKACRQPVYRLLGGKVREKIPAYANGWYRVERTPEGFAEAARRVVERGYLGLKFDPFGSGDLELTRKEFHRYGAQDFAPLFALGVVDVIQPDITQCGGILEVKKIASTAETHGVVVAPHNVGGAVSTAAVVHLAATLRNIKVIEHFNDFVDQEVQEAASPYPRVVDGNFSLGAGPGLGLSINEEFIRAHPPRTEGGVILDPGLDMFRDAAWNLRGRKAKE